MQPKADYTIENSIDKPAAVKIKELLSDTEVILASSSLRRIKVFKLLGLNFLTYCPLLDESSNPSIDPVQFAEANSLMKAMEASGYYLDTLVIAADTVVVLENQILGKPENAEEARRMLTMLRSKQHRVITAVSCYNNGMGMESVSHEETDVFFRDFTDKELSDYVKSGEPLDKAGSYGIQGMGSILVDRISGELDNVIGMPLNCLAQLLGVESHAL
ncbi:MAG: septum formation protein Maf [candidate division Zixibacteria bacterium]|nr:septum formation protein Maf [candidate division Zixibacteria bacterium]